MRLLINDAWSITTNPTFGINSQNHKKDMTGHKYSVIYFVWSNTHSSTQCHQVFFCVCWFSIFIAHCCVRTNMSVWTFVLLVNEIFEWLFQHRHIPKADWAYDQEEEIIVTATRRIFVATMRCNFSNTFFIANKLKGFIVGREERTEIFRKKMSRTHNLLNHCYAENICSEHTPSTIICVAVMPIFWWSSILKFQIILIYRLVT